MKMKKILPTHGRDRHFHFIGLVDQIMCNGIFFNHNPNPLFFFLQMGKYLFFLQKINLFIWIKCCTHYY